MSPYKQKPEAQIELEDERMPELRELDFEVLRLLGSEEGTVAFQGLRRRMRIHQERLSRSLQRLEEDGFVLRTPRGYAITPKGSLLTHRLLSPASTPSTVILQSFIPGDVSPNTIASRLEGRWFGNLRWIGIRERPDGATLRWMTGESGVEVSLKVKWGQVILETNATEPSAMIEAFVGAQRIFGQLTGPWCQDWSQPQLSVST